jgi:hypothetical protein
MAVALEFSFFELSVIVAKWHQSKAIWLELRVGLYNSELVAVKRGRFEATVLMTQTLKLIRL